MCAVFLLPLLAWPIVGRLWIASMDAQRLRSPVNMFRLSGSMGSILLQIGFRCDRAAAVPFSFAGYGRSSYVGT